MHLKAVVLAGGFATRLRPLSCTRPKILFPIVNKPMLQWTYERLAKNNVKDVVLAVFYQTEVHIKQHHVPRCGLQVNYSRDPLRKPLGTGGAIKRTEKRVGHDSPFLALNGDTFADIDYSEMLKRHEKNNCTATIALHEVPDPSRYGVATLAIDNRIKGFFEKPASGKVPSNLINAGTYVLNPRIFKYIPEGRTVSIEREVFPKLVEEHELYGYVHHGLWTDIGKPEDYKELNRTMLDRNGGRLDYKGEDAKIKGPVDFDKDVSIGRGSIIGPYTVLGHSVTIGTYVDIENSILLPGTEVSDNAQVHNAIIGEGVYIGKKVKVRQGCIIGDHAKVEDNVSLPAGTSICPAKEVSEEGF